MRNIYIIVIAIASLIAIGIFAGTSNHSSSETASHQSPLNPAMSDFFDQYDIYFTGWNNYLRNGQDLGLTETGSSSLQAFELGMSKNATSTATEAEISRQIKKGQTEGRVLTVLPHSAFVIESHSPNEANLSYGSLTPTVLQFNGETFTRDAVNSNYYVDGNHIVYVGCLEQTFNERSNGNLCSQYGLYVDHKLIDQTFKSDANKFFDLTIYPIRDHVVYYSKSESGGDNPFFAYNLETGIKSPLSASDGFECELLGFVNRLPVNLCVNFDKYPSSDISVGGVRKYEISRSKDDVGSVSQRILVANDHVYYSVVNKPADSSSPIKASLIRDGLKVAEAEEASSQYFYDGYTYPTNGTDTGCLFANDQPGPSFCIVGNDVISRSNFGFDQNEYYLNGQIIDFTNYYNVILTPQDPKWDGKKPSIWQLDFLPDSKGKLSKVLFETLSPHDIYVSDILPNNTISSPQLLVSNVGAIVGASHK